MLMDMMKYIQETLFLKILFSLVLYVQRYKKYYLINLNLVRRCNVMIIVLYETFILLALERHWRLRALYCETFTKLNLIKPTFGNKSCKSVAV